MKKKLNLLACTLFMTALVWAQENVTTNMKTTEEIDDRNFQSLILLNGSSYDFIFNWKEKPTKSHWTGIGFAFSGLRNLHVADLNQNRSYSVILNLADYTIPLSYHYLFVTGLGFDWSRYHFRRNTGLQYTDGIATFFKDTEREYKSSKLLVYYATIPFLLEYQTKTTNGSHFFISGGIEGLVKCYSKSQLDIRQAQGNIEEIHYRNPNIPPLNARLILRTGFDNFSFFGYYQLFSMFEKGKGPDVRSFGIGLMLN
ncbi:MAG: hypothetical protein LBG28_09165 [Tannerella sp.]|jgi:hypothetical protein|nr:hypothetical protein [Tannerella sp.]